MWRPEDFARTRADFLESLVAEMNMPLFKLVQEYQQNPEFKEHVDIAALMLSGSETIH